MNCDICGGPGPHGLHECRANLLARVKEVQRRASALPERKGPIKDQSGVALSEAFMKMRGLGRYAKRETAKTLELRVTEPITLEHFILVVSDGKCLSCNGPIRHIKMAAGGRFWVCGEEGRETSCGWYIGWRASAGRGEQLKLERAA